MNRVMVNMNIITVMLAIVVGLSACSSMGAGLGSRKGTPADVSSSYAPELSAAYKAYEEGRLSDAETHFIQYTNKYPNYSEAWFRLGNIYYRTGQYSAAITSYTNVVQQQPKHGKAWYNMALTRIKQAEETLERGEAQLKSGDIQRLRLTSLKNKIRSGVRQYKPTKKKSKKHNIYQKKTVKN